jgi:hypothetical protein
MSDKHHRIAQQVVGAVDTDEVIHHVDEDPANNHPSNLRVMSRGEHGRLHHQVWEMCLCEGCGELFRITPQQRRDRKERPNKTMWCSLECYRNRGR